MKKFKDNIYKYWYIYVIVILLIVIIIMIHTRHYKWSKNVLISNIEILFQIIAYASSALGIITIFLNYNRIKDTLLNNRMTRSKDEYLYFSKHINPLIKSIEEDTQNHYIKYMKDHHLSIYAFNAGMFRESLLNTFNKRLSDIKKIGSWIDTLYYELDKNYLDNDLMESKVGLTIIEFLYYGRSEFYNDGLFEWYDGCANLYFHKWKNLVKKIKRSDE